MYVILAGLEAQAPIPDLAMQLMLQEG
jgi:hypothetical protein